MQTAAAVSASPPDLLRRRLHRPAAALSFSSSPSRNLGCLVSNTGSRFSRVVVASSPASFDGLDAKDSSISSSSKNSVLVSLVQEIEPLDVSLIQKEVPAETVDAMKRTISGMLGLLPSDQFKVLVEAPWNPVKRLLVSSMMTGYTLRNAEYRLSFERNLDFSEEDSNNKISRESVQMEPSRSDELAPGSGKKDNYEENNKLNQDLGFEGLGELSSQARDYIIQMQARLNSIKKELHDLKRKNSALQMQQFVGEEKNDLLDYLRSLKPEKVAELSEPTCEGVEEAIHSVAHGLLATLSPKMHSIKNNNINNNDNNNNAALNFGKNENNNDDDCTELVENTSINFQPHLSVPRDYLARLLFWCMLLGHYLRGLEYRLELMQLYNISKDMGSIPNNNNNGDFVA
ncbi:hypothetical protein LUZ60_004939 [Juncus effusus]|nr:hypothetical protein LUZ60_004939 [Juncus effusus]